MIKHTLVVLLCLVSECLFCQVITISELINKTKCEDFACFNEYIVTKGFSYKRNKVIEGITGYEWLSNATYTVTSNPKIIMNHRASFFVSEDGGRTTMFSTVVQKDFLSFTAEMKTLKFVSKKTDTSKEESVAVEYVSPNYPKIIITVTTTTKVDIFDRYTYYDFNVQKFQ